MDATLHTVNINEISVPALGYGMAKVPANSAVRAVEQALDVGYRQFDTAQMYGNEVELGQAVRASGIPRDEIFITTKLDNTYLDYESSLRGVHDSLDAIGVDYIDMYLIHWPLAQSSDYVDRWRALEKAYSDGIVRFIGVSNFQIHHLDRLLASCEISPTVNQIELHPYLTQDTLIEYHSKNSIVTQCWSPLGKGQVLSDSTIVEMAHRHGRTPAQIVLKWHLQSNRWVFPKSLDPHRMAENFRVFDFELSSEDIKQLSLLNRELRTGPHPDTFEVS